MKKKNDYLVQILSKWEKPLREGKPLQILNENSNKRTK